MKIIHFLKVCIYVSEKNLVSGNVIIISKDSITNVRFERSL